MLRATGLSLSLHLIKSKGLCSLHLPYSCPFHTLYKVHMKYRLYASHSNTDHTERLFVDTHQDINCIGYGTMHNNFTLFIPKQWMQ